MLRFRRATVAVLILLTFWPTLVFGQAASRAGVVTTLEGRATAARVVLPNPVPLHFKDDVFLNDEITTAEKSLARILLGGKAVVTVRERSSLTITEVPGLSTIDIASGKIAMAVARERMRPGEQIQIRTPNAITGIRGTSLIVEVIRSIADTKQADPNAITRLGVFNGNVDVQHINPITKAPLAPPVNVAINTKFSASGSQPAAVVPFQPGDAASFQQGVTPSGPQHVQAANEQALAAQATETANALLTALGAGAVVAPPIAPTPVSTVDTRPELNDDKTDVQPSCSDQPTQPGCSPQIVVQPPPPRVGLFAGVPSNITIDPALAPFLGSATTSVVEIPSGASRITTAGSAIEVDTSTPTPAELAIPLLTVADGDLDVRGHLLNVLGTLTATTTLPLIGLDPTTLSVAGDLVRVDPGAVMSVAGPLVSDNSGTLTVGGSLIAVEPGGELVSRSERPLVELEESNVTVGSSLVRIDGGRAYLTGSAVEVTDARVTTNSLVDLRGVGRLVTGDSFDPLFDFRDGSEVTAARGIVFNANPGAVLRVDRDLVRVSDSQLTVDGALVDMNAGLLLTSNLVARVEDRSTLTVGGPLVRLTGGSVFGATVLLFSDGSGNRLSLGGLLDISDSTAVVGQLREECDCRFQDVIAWTLGPNQPIVRLTNGELTVTDASTAIRREGFDEGPASEPGVSLIATAPGSGGGSVISVPNGTLLGLGGVSLSDPNAQLQLSGADVSVGNALIRVFRESTTAGPLLDAVGSLILAERNELLGIYAPLLVNGTGQALLRFADSLVTTGTEIVLLDGNARLQLSRGLVDAVNTSFVTQAFDTFVTIGNGGTLTATTSSPLISLTSSPVTMQFGEDFIHVGSSIFGGESRAALSVTGGGSLVRLAAMDFGLTSSGALLRVTGSDVTLAGPILEAVNANLTFDGPVVYVANSGRLTTSAGPAFKITGGSLTADSLIGTDGEGNVVIFTGTVADFGNTTVTLNRAERALEPIIAVSGGSNVPLLRMSSSTLTLNEPQPLFDFGVDDGAPIALGGVVMIATGSAASPSVLNVPSLMDLGGVTFTSGNPLIQLTQTVVNQTLPASLITVSGGSVTTGGPLLSASASTFNLGGSLLDVVDGSLIADGDGGGAFLQLFGSTLTSPADLVRVGETSVSLDRGFLDAIDTTFRTGAGALVAVDVADVTVAGNLLRFAGTSAAGRLLAVRNTRLDARSSLLHLDAGTLTVNSPAPGAALQILNSGVETGSHLVSLVSNSRLALDRGLLDSVDSSVATRDGSIVAAFGDARVSSTSAAPLLRFSGNGDGSGTVTADDNFINLAAAVPGGPAPSMTLGGPLMAATLMDIANGDRENARSFVSLFDGARLASSSSQPLVALDRSSLDTTGSLISVRRSGPAASTLELAGPLFAAQNSNVTVFSTALRDTANAPRLCCSLLGVGQGGRLTSSTTDALIDLVGTSAFVGSRFAVVFDTTSILGEAEIIAPGVVNLAGPLARIAGGPTAAGSVIALEDFLGVFRSSLTSTTAAPLISLDRAAVSLGGTSPFDPELIVPGRFLQVAGSATTPSTLTLAGPLLSASDSVITANDDLFAVFGGGRLTSTSTQPLISLTGGSVSAGANGNFFVMAAAAGVPPPVVTLAGPLLRARGPLVLSNGDPARNTQAFVFVGDGARLASTSPEALLDFGGAAVVTGTLLSVRRPGATPSSVDLDGGLLIATDSSITTSSSALRDSDNEPILCCNVLSVGQGATFNSDSTAPLIDIVRTSITSGARLVSVFDATSILNEPSFPSARAFLTLDGPLLRAQDAFISSAQDVLGIFGASVTSTTPAPLITATRTELRLGQNAVGAPLTEGRLLLMQGSAGLPAVLNISGPIFVANDSVITATAGGFGLFNGSHGSSTTAQPFISITGGSFTGGPIGAFVGLASFPGQPASSLTLQGPLLSATGTSLLTGFPAGNPPSNPSFIFVGNGGTLSSTTNAPLLAFAQSSVDSASSFVTVRSSTPAAVTAMTLAGPLLTATDSRFTTGGFSGFFIGEGSRLSSTSALPLIDLTNSTFNGAPGEQTGFDFFDVVTNGGAPATVTLAGPLLKATGSRVTANANSFLVVNGSTVTSTSQQALVQLDRAEVSASRNLAQMFDAQLLASTVAALAVATGDSRMTTGSHAVDMAGNTNVELKDLVRLTNSIMTVNNGHLVNMNGGRLNVTGNLVALTGNSTLNLLNGLLLNMLGGNATIGGSLVNFTGAGNTINVTNTFRPTHFLNGVPVFVGANTQIPQISGTALTGLGANGSININGAALTAQNAASATGSLIAVQNGATLRIGPAIP